MNELGTSRRFPHIALTLPIATPMKLFRQKNCY